MTTLLQSITEIEDQHTSGGYSKRPLTIVRGRRAAPSTTTRAMPIST
ncbi:MAG: hypothetical protein U0521_02790 [Anaerolineae bacterium]